MEKNIVQSNYLLLRSPNCRHNRLVRELRSRKLHCAAKKKDRTGKVNTVWLVQGNERRRAEDGRPRCYSDESGFYPKQQRKPCFIFSNQLFQSSLGLLSGW